MNPEKVLSLHSRYNPQKEAERYIESLLLSGNIRFFILVEPGLGYMISPLRKRFPAAKIVSLHAEALFSGSNSPRLCAAGDAEWYPETGISLQDFLEKEIPDTGAEEIKLVEWRPARTVYGESYAALIGETAKFIKRIDANTRTVKAFGRRWFGNFLKNLTLFREFFLPVSFSVPILVAGAGPGLEDAFPLIREGDGEELFILTVSSAAAAMEAGGILPGMLISTDGGAWAKYHLYETFRGEYRKIAGRIPLAAAVTAALPSQCGNLPVLPISDGSLWQTLILKELDIPFIVLPQRGTVSAAAIDLAFALTKGEIYIAGIDLANNDIRSHAKPYSFDRFLEGKAGRLNPLYSQVYGRSSALKAGGSYDIYASWFRKQLDSYPKPLHSLGKNNLLFGTAEKTAGRKARGSGSAAETGFPGVSVKREGFSGKRDGFSSENVFTLLEKKLMEDSAAGAALFSELSSLFFPGKSPAKKELIEALGDGTGKSYG